MLLVGANLLRAAAVTFGLNFRGKTFASYRRGGTKSESEFETNTGPEDSEIDRTPTL